MESSGGTLTTETPRITVTGEATVTRKPDLAYITLYLRSEGILLEDAVKEADGALDQIKGKLRNTYPEIFYPDMGTGMMCA